MSTQFFDLSRLALINGRLNFVTPSGEITPLTASMLGEAPEVANAVQTWVIEPNTGDVVLWPYGVLGFGVLGVIAQEGESLDAAISMSEDGLTVTLLLGTDEEGVSAVMEQAEFEALLDELIAEGKLAGYVAGSVGNSVQPATLTAEIEGTAGTPGMVGWPGQIAGQFVVCSKTDETIANHYWQQPAYD